ncbi:DUF7448 domain-containing protein [Priestia flexa]|uniref:DUF7448 domain-containing protein n=1 Tax=Priestia flexa TaxID=86664 RepID=UPI003D034003
MFGKLMHLLNHEDVNVLVGKTLSDIQNNDNEELLFRTTNGETYKMYHEQNCCESVSIEEIIGDLDDLIGSPITMAEEVSQEGEDSDWGTSTWTFYKFATNKGYVTIRWLGESNGYYSESVDFRRVQYEE